MRSSRHGGLLAGLGYAVIDAALPQSLWTRASGLVSAMWGVATVVGPAMGGFFAQFGLWRWAFGAVAVLTAAMAVLVPRVLPAGRVDPSDAAPVLRMPVWWLLLLGSRRHCGHCATSAPFPVDSAQWILNLH